MEVPLVTPNAIEKTHTNMEYDQTPFLTWVVTLPLQQDYLDDESSSLQVILEVMDSPVDNPRELMPLDASSLPN